MQGSEYSLSVILKAKMYSWYCFILNFVRVHKDDKEDMEMAFKEVAIEVWNLQPFTKISKEWMLVTAGDEKKE